MRTDNVKVRQAIFREQAEDNPLAAAVLGQALRDWMTGWSIRPDHHLVFEVEHWIRSKEFRVFSQLDPEWLIAKLHTLPHKRPRGGHPQVRPIDSKAGMQDSDKRCEAFLVSKSACSGCVYYCRPNKQKQLEQSINDCCDYTIITGSLRPGKETEHGWEPELPKDCSVKLTTKNAKAVRALLNKTSRNLPENIDQAKAERIALLVDRLYDIRGMLRMDILDDAKREALAKEDAEIVREINEIRHTDKPSPPAKPRAYTEERLKRKRDRAAEMHKIMRGYRPYQLYHNARANYAKNMRNGHPDRAEMWKKIADENLALLQAKRKELMNNEDQKE